MKYSLLSPQQPSPLSFAVKQRKKAKKKKKNPTVALNQIPSYLETALFPIRNIRAEMVSSTKKAAKKKKNHTETFTYRKTLGTFWSINFQQLITQGLVTQ